MRDNVVFESGAKWLSLKQKKGDDGKYQKAIFSYSKFIRPPLNFELDVRSLDQCTLGIGFGGANFHLVSKDKLETAVLNAIWVSGRKPDGSPIIDTLANDKTVKIADATPIRFRLPVPNAPIHDTFELRVAEIWGVNPILLSGMTVQAKFAPLFGIDWEVQDNLVFAKKVFGGLAQKAGVQEGDILIKINGQQPSSNKEAVELMRKMEIGDTCTLVLKRGDQEVTIPIKAE
jgi:hypothetical protein